MRLGWVVVGILIAIAIFIIFPKIFETMVSLMRQGFDVISSFLKGRGSLTS
jgi:hypothetical protein